MEKRVLCYIGILVVLYSIFQNVRTDGGVKKGHYKMKLDSIRNCSKTTLSPAPNEMMKLDIMINNRGFIHGNMTIRKNNLKSELFLWEDGKWNLLLRLPGWSCDRYFMGMLLTAMKIDYDKTKCSLTEGTYQFKNMDVDYFSHVWRAEIEYGRMLSRVEFLNRKYTYVCRELEMSTTPL